MPVKNYGMILLVAELTQLMPEVGNVHDELE
jgi:hypothetical protein